MPRISLGLMAPVTVLAMAAGPTAAYAETPEEFFRGKTVTLAVGSGPGGGYDAYSRTLSRYA